MAMESATSPAENPVIELAHPIQSRDGTLTTDARLVNCCIEQTENGKAVVKRPGTFLVQQPSFTGPVQGQFTFSYPGQAPTAFSIVNDTLFQIGTLNSYVLPGLVTAGEQYQCLSDVPMGTSIIKSTSGMWIFNGTSAAKVTDANYPTLTVAGIAYLDGTYYVMDGNGNVQGSALEDPTTWPALNFIAADATLGFGAGIIRHLNYLVALYTKGTQLYWDAGQSPGIPIAAVSNASWRTGCSTNVNTGAVEIQDMTFWVANTGPFGRSVVQMSGLQLTTISNPFIERILNRSPLSSVYVYGIKAAGHSYFVLTLLDIDITLVYDLIFQQWYQWTSVVNGVEHAFRHVNYVAANDQDLLQDLDTGATVQMQFGTYNDVGAVPINTRIVTPNMDWKTMSWKRFAALFLLADTVNSTVELSFTDDDYQTFSVPRTIDLSSVRKMLQRCGRSRRRAWQLLHTANTPFKVYQMEARMSIGPQ